jgi:hypothetical protein
MQPRWADHELMKIQIEALFCCNAYGRMLHSNEPGPEGSPPPAPRFFLGRTAHGNFWRFRYDLPDALVGRLDELCHSEPVCTDFTQKPVYYDAIRDRLQTHRPVGDEYRGPAFWIPKDRPPSANTVLISAENMGLVQQPFGFSHPIPAERLPVVAVVEDGMAVAVCFSSRTTSRASEAGVETLGRFRGRGYATAAVSAWAAEVRKAGRIPLYSTSWDNLASQAIARKLDMVCYGEDFSLE